jgi:hypothetical protein
LKTKPSQERKPGSSIPVTISSVPKLRLADTRA